MIHWICDSVADERIARHRSRIPSRSINDNAFGSCTSTAKKPPTQHLSFSNGVPNATTYHSISNKLLAGILIEQNGFIRDCMVSCLQLWVLFNHQPTNLSTKLQITSSIHSSSFCDSASNIGAECNHAAIIHYAFIPTTKSAGNIQAQDFKNKAAENGIPEKLRVPKHPPLLYSLRPPAAKTGVIRTSDRYYGI